MFRRTTYTIGKIRTEHEHHIVNLAIIILQIRYHARVLHIALQMTIYYELESRSEQLQANRNKIKAIFVRRICAPD
jgi:hypothetical protein